MAPDPDFHLPDVFHLQWTRGQIWSHPPWMARKQHPGWGYNSGVEPRTQGLVNKLEQSGRRGKRNRSLKPSSLPHGKFKTSPSYRSLKNKYRKLHFVVKKLSPRGK